MQTEDREPGGIAAGQSNNASQQNLRQNKHFQRASATVLCGTVNFGAEMLLSKTPATSN
jgi:hypothetical protein